MDTETLYYKAARPREACADAKDWLLDCFGDDPDAEKQIMLLSGVTIVKAVEQHYDGGWLQFLRDSFNLKGTSGAVSGASGLTVTKTSCEKSLTRSVAGPPTNREERENEHPKRYLLL